MKILIDMNLSPEWVSIFLRHGWLAKHWSSIGEPRAQDRTIADWPRINGYIIFTHDLDFGTLLALCRATGPSVIQVRAQNVLPDHLRDWVIAALRQYESELTAGALVVVDESRSRVRILPIGGI